MPRNQLTRSLGEGGKNIYELRRILRKKIKIIPQPDGIKEVKSFIGNIVRPVEFKEIEITPQEIIINAGGMQNKAALIGKNKRRLIEMQRIIKDFFGKDFRII
ncbi:MAG: hypothetical protein PHU63_04200 [Candidatus ainarchaeum sp.]|nr:hypothetical protein [Candidatus ainarchaeum sp.]